MIASLSQKVGNLLVLGVLVLAGCGGSNTVAAGGDGTRPVRRNANIITAEDIEMLATVTSIEDVISRLGSGVIPRRSSDGQMVLTLMGAGTPLWVIDGVPIEARGPMGINPRDVERIEIIKQGGALAQYGFRGSGGVILVTSKSSSRG